MTLEVIAETLHARRAGPNRYMARCVAHEDRTPSLSLTERDGKILVHCFAGCSQTQLLQRLKELGLLWHMPTTTPQERRNYAQKRTERAARVRNLEDYLECLDRLKLHAGEFTDTWKVLCREQREVRREIEALGGSQAALHPRSFRDVEVIDASRRIIAAAGSTS